MKLRNKYFILRHGETIYQTRKRNFIYPQKDTASIKLTKKGKDQIKAVAQKLKKTKIDLIYSSDFFRTKETAQIVAKELDKKIIFDKRLRDINLGIYQGRKKEEFYQKFPRISKKGFKQRPSRGESWSDCQKRMLNFLKDLEKKHKGKTILIISHGDPLWLLEGGVKKWSVEKFIKTAKTNNYIKVGEIRKLN